MKTQGIVLWICFSLFLSACGGGGSSSGGPSSINDGDYNGTLMISGSGPNVIADTTTLIIAFSIQNNIVTSITLDGTTGQTSIPVVNNSFQFLEPADIMTMTDFDDIACTGMLALTVNLLQGNANGNTSSVLDCTLLDTSIQITTTLTLSANR